MGATSWPRPQALTVRGRCPCHPGQVPTISQCPLVQPTPRATRSPSASGRPWSPAARSVLANASRQGQGLRDPLPWPSNLKGLGGRCEGRGQIPIGCRSEGVEPGRRTARAGPRSRLRGNPEGGPRGPLRLESAGHRVRLSAGAAQRRFSLETALGGGGGWS